MYQELQLALYAGALMWAILTGIVAGPALKRPSWRLAGLGLRVLLVQLAVFGGFALLAVACHAGVGLVAESKAAQDAGTDALLLVLAMGGLLYASSTRNRSERARRIAAGTPTD